MSLQVWLPLNGDLRNNGLDTVTISAPNGSFIDGGKINQKCFTGYSSNFDIPSMVGAKQVSISYWVKINTATATNWLDSVHFWVTDGTTRYINRQEFYNNCTKTGFWYRYDGVSGLDVEIGKWTHYVISVDYISGIAQLYENGVLKYKRTNADTSFSVEGSFGFGENGLDISENDLRIYDHILTQKEIKELSKALTIHYKLDTVTSTNVYDCSGYCYDGEINGTLTIDSNTPRYGYSTYFNGDDSAITVPYNIACPNNVYTINLWFYKSELGSKGYETLFGGPSGFEMDTRAGSASTLSLYMATTRGGSIVSSLPFNEWTMVTYVRDGTNESAYINGEFIKSIEAKAMPTGTYYIGAWKTSTQQNYKGLISDFRLYNTVLSVNDILELYNSIASGDRSGNFYVREAVEV